MSHPGRSQRSSGLLPPQQKHPLRLGDNSKCTNEAELFCKRELWLGARASVVLTMQLIDGSTQQQHGQREGQAAGHGHALPRVGDIPQALDGQDPLVRHCRSTQTQLRAKVYARVAGKGGLLLLGPCGSCQMKAATRVHKI